MTWRPFRSTRPMDAFSPVTFVLHCRCRPLLIPPSMAMPCAAAIFRGVTSRLFRLRKIAAAHGLAIDGDLPRGDEQAFQIAGRVQAGSPAGGAIRPGQATRIFTGAPMPEGADTGFMQEGVRLDEDGRG